MLNISKNITLTGSSNINIDGIDTVVMTMNANISDDNSVNISKYIQDRNLYEGNRDAADADYADFEKHVNEIIQITTDK